MTSSTTTTQPPEKANKNGKTGKKATIEPEKQKQVGQPFKIPGVTSIPRVRTYSAESSKTESAACNRSQQQLTSTRIMDEDDEYMVENGEERMDTSRKEFDLARESRELLAGSDSDGDKELDVSLLDDINEAPHSSQQQHEPMHTEEPPKKDYHPAEQLASMVDQGLGQNAGRTPPRHSYGRRLSAHNSAQEEDNEEEREGRWKDGKEMGKSEKSDRKKARDAQRAQEWKKNSHGHKNSNNKGRNAKEDKRTGERRQHAPNESGSSESSRPPQKKNRRTTTTFTVTLNPLPAAE